MTVGELVQKLSELPPNALVKVSQEEYAPYDVRRVTYIPNTASANPAYVVICGDGYLNSHLGR